VDDFSLDKHKHTNRLIDESSPYLQQHAHNPVDWYPWCDEALERAMQEGKPILLSIGYSACHWCHVMAHESFENEKIARLMNEKFINIKVDREERPDLDAIYMEAVQLIGGSGGWPLTVFLTPDREPFYGGTYFPPEDKHSLPGFERVLNAAASAYKDRRDQVINAANQLVAHLNQTSGVIADSGQVSAHTLTNAYVSLKSLGDPQNGGFGLAPKFPQPMVLEYLLRHWYRTGDTEALSMVENALVKMAKGGIYDQIGGGFHRYSVDAKWLVPHFEKMLYDNALLSRIYTRAYQATGNDLFKRIACETLDYVIRQMRDSSGGFYSTQDADSEGVEGKYYIWTPDEIVNILGREDGELFYRYFGVTERGNFEGSNILSKVVDEEVLAAELGIDPVDLIARIEMSKKLLLTRRSTRISPHRDEKILCSWNGLMLTAFAEAAIVFDRQDYLEVAIDNAKFLTEVMYKDGRLSHSFKDGRGTEQSFLQDYAFICEALVRLYQATFNENWLSLTLSLADGMIALFWDEDRRSFYDTGEGQRDLLVRPRNVYDNALPSGSSAAAMVLLYLSRLTDNSRYERIALHAMNQMVQMIAQYPLGFGNWLCDIDFYLSQPKELVVTGRPEDIETKLIINTIARYYLPNAVQARVDPGNTSLNIPLLKDRMMIDNLPTVYICEGFTCKAPLTDRFELELRLDALN
jgi:uncharacterized protein YyaL (SSP411 family)